MSKTIYVVKTYSGSIDAYTDEILLFDNIEQAKAAAALIEFKGYTEDVIECSIDSLEIETEDYITKFQEAKVKAKENKKGYKKILKLENQYEIKSTS